MTQARRGHGQGTLYKRTPKGPWIASWQGHNGKRRVRSTRTTDKAAAQRILAKLVSDESLRREGVIDPIDEAIAVQSRRSIAAHLDDYHATLTAAQRTNKHIEATIGYIKQIAEHAKFNTPRDIHADAVNRFAAAQQKEGRSARTIQAYLRAIKSFTRWLAKHGKLPRDPLVTVTTPNPENDRRTKRRFLLPEEWHAIAEAIREDARDRGGMTANERIILYATAIQTALRAREIASLKPHHVHLDVEPQFIRCEAASAKNRKAARQYIKPETAVALRELLRNRKPDERLFRLPDLTDLASVLRDDMAHARDRWLNAPGLSKQEKHRRAASDFLLPKNHAGQWLDFHSLRHTCGAWLAMAGAHPKAIQTVMRHSSITLTMDTYGHLFPGQEAQTIAKLPDMLGDRIKTR